MGGIFMLSYCTVYGYDNQPKKGKGEKRKKGWGMHAYCIYNNLG
jgi:hypothetical protein